MSTVEKAQRLFAECGKLLGANITESTENKSYRFTLKNGCELFVDYLEPVKRMMFVAPMMELPQKDNEDALLDLLELNMYWDELAGGQFALFLERNEVVLVRQFEIDTVEPKSFCNALARFMEAAAIWFDALNERTETEKSSAPKQDFMRV